MKEMQEKHGVQIRRWSDEDLASFEKVRESIALDGVFPDDGARTALRALSQFDTALRSERVDVARSFSNDFARRAKERFNA